MNLETRATMNEDLKLISELADSLAKKGVFEHVHDYEYPYARQVAGVVGIAGEIGLFGINLPEDRGGIGLGAPALSGILEKISAYDAGIAGILFTHAAALELIAVAAEADGESCRSIYELAAAPGCAPLAFQSYSSPDEVEMPEVTGDKNQMSGRLSFVVLGGMARYAVLPGARKGGKGFSYYLVDLFAIGVQKSAPVLSIGLQAAQAVDIILNNVPSSLIGAEGQGETYFRKMQSRMAIPAAAISLGIIQGSFKEALEYAKQRYQGGRNIVNWSGVRMKLADMAIQVDAGKRCLSGASTAFEGAADAEDGAAIAAALHISDMACGATSEGVQLLGGAGYMKDYGQEKRMRDANQARSLLGMIGVKKMKYIAKIIEEVNV
jgi:alkylation response protein AidB-like acyl-CoA dehydrogenase